MSRVFLLYSNPEILTFNSCRRLKGASMDRIIPKSSLPKSGCPAHTLASVWEIIFATSCSTITSSYIIHHESHKATFNAETILHEFLKFSDEYHGHFSFILNPSPALMLASCLVLGCAVSSFAYRRQDRDKLQMPIFLAAISLACTLGFAWQLNANMIMLGMIPWALCLAMFLCTIMNAVWGTHCRSRIVYAQVNLRCCEKGQLDAKENTVLLVT